MHIELVKDIEEFHKTRAAWEALCDAVGESGSVFCSYAWYETWWRNFADGAALSLLMMWESDKLVGVAPLMRRATTLHGLPVTIIGFIENRNSLHNDFIVMPDARDMFLREGLRVLFEQSGEWDVIVFNNLPTTSANYGALLIILDEAGKKWRQGPTFTSPYLILSGTWAEYLAGRSTRTRKSLRNIHNSLHKAGEISVRNIRSWEEFQQARTDLLQVAKQSWTDEIGDSLATPVNEAFFDTLACRAAEKGWLSLWTLHLNSKMIAFEFHLKGYGKNHAMRSSYLPEFAALSPGTYLENQIILHAFEESGQMKQYDFGGCFDPYKRKWTDDAVPHCELLLFNDNIYSRFVAFHEMRTVPLVKRVRNRIKKVTGKH